MAKDFDFESYMREMINMSREAGKEMRSFKKGVREQDQAHQERLAVAHNASQIEVAKIGQQGKLAEVAELTRQRPQASIDAVGRTITDPINKKLAEETFAKEDQPRVDREAARPVIGQLKRGMAANAAIQAGGGDLATQGFLKTAYKAMLPNTLIWANQMTNLQKKGLTEKDIMSPEQQTAGTEKLRQLNEGVRKRNRINELIAKPPMD